MNKAVAITVLFVSLSAFAGKSIPTSNPHFPTGPDVSLTPGDFCHQADSYRYPERIPYCDRNVEPGLKSNIIVQYDHLLGFSIENMPRGKFKIDHYIPLCMGGSNEASNLWPQHESVYTITDPLEPVICQKMSEGKLLQAEAIDLIKQAKNHLDEAPAILKKVTALK
jgi:hypothetical protein